MSGARTWRVVGALMALVILAHAHAQSPTGEGACEGATSVSVCAVSAGGAAVGRVLRAALQARGVPAHEHAAPPECGMSAGGAGGDFGGGAWSRACSGAVLRLVAGGALHVAVVPLVAARPPHVLALRDHGLEEMGDAAPPARLVCAATPPARSLTDLADPRLATAYRLPPTCLDVNATQEAEAEEGGGCAGAGDSCGVLVAGDEGEAHELRRVVRALRLRVLVRAATPCAPRAPLVCTRDPLLLPAGLPLLALPPCAATTDFEECPFEPYRLVKIANARALARSPTASRVVGRVALDAAEVRAARLGGAAASAHIAARRGAWGGRGEARVVAMVPARAPQHAYEAGALRAAAELAELDAPPDDYVDLKVELLDDGCAAPRAFKYLTDAAGAEFNALSAVAGPACAAAFADVARQSPALRMPVLAYTAQAPPPGGPALLAAGDARDSTLAWGALAARVGWRRVAVLSEVGTRAALDLAALGLEVPVHLELATDGADLDLRQIDQWARRVAAAGARVALVAGQDARVVRAALCAGRAAVAAWLLPAALPRHWLRRAPTDRHPCTDQQLRDAAEGHLSVVPAWLARWEDDAEGEGGEAGEWRARWRTRCAGCGAPPAHAAALYDALRVWLRALRHLLRTRPAALDDLHCNHTVRWLVAEATATNYSGLTGRFEWAAVGADGAGGDVWARADAMVLRQWRGGVQRRAGEWRGAWRAGPTAHWRTADGRAPDDGSERCALGALAALLRADCRTAFVALGAALLVALAAALGATAYACKRRAERDYRRRLAALGLRALAPRADEPDRWEIPRERVVINRKLGTGAFGTVYGGHALLAEDRGWSAVAVKTLKAGASTEEKLDFLSEAEAMKRFEHKNVVRLLGVVTKTEPVCTVMEFMLYGDLKNYLLARRHLAGEEAGGAEGEVSAARLTGMALDAARALGYLAQLRFVHRDVAARNCLLSARRVLKLADFGMTRPVFDSDYYRFSRKGMLPVRWMAPESLALGVFSPASDVWSYGVLLYEIVTFGSLPFQGLSNAEVLTRVKAGRTLDLPPGIKPQLAGLIKSCWSAEARARPRAAEVAAFLAEWPRLLAPCLDVPLDALALEPDRAQARWVSWGSPASAATDTTYLSADGAPHDDTPPQDTDAFLP